jgi:hypothetical protein
MKKLITLLAIIFALNVFGEDSKTNKTSKVTELQTKENKWNSYVNSQPLLKQKVALLAAYKAQQTKAQENLNYLLALAVENAKSKGKNYEFIHPTPEVVKGDKLVAELSKKVETTEALVKIERIKWEKAMDKR